MAITRSNDHKRRATGGKRHPHHKKRKFASGRPAAMTAMGSKRIHIVRGRGGNLKYRALRLEKGLFSWGSEVVAKTTRIIGVVYNASNNELVRTNTLVKNCVVEVDSSPFKEYYEKHYRIAVPKKGEDVEKTVTEIAPAGKVSGHVKAALAAIRKDRIVDPRVLTQMQSGRCLAIIASRPGQSGRADGYILEGPELEFYQKKLAIKKGAKGEKA